MGNSESRPNVENKPEQWHNAVNGNTEQLNLSPKPNINHAAFETTSENENFTQSEKNVPIPLSPSKHMVHENVKHEQLVGGAFDFSDIFNKLSSIMNDTEMSGGIPDHNIDEQLNHIRNLLNETETNTQSGGYDAHPLLLNKLRDLLSQDTETNLLIQDGGSIDQPLLLNKLRDLLSQDTETNLLTQDGGSIDQPLLLNKLRDLLSQDTETNLLTQDGGSAELNKLRNILLEDTETNFINFKGGALDKENLFSENSLTGGEHSEKHKKHEDSEKHKKHEESEKHKKHEESEKHKKHEESEKHKEVEERELVDASEKQEEEEQKTDQSGGEQLDTELKNILLELQANNKNLNKYKGGKSSKKSSRKSKKSKKSNKSSKKQSRRSSASNMSDETYNIDSDSDTEDYLTSTSSMNTSDINLKHYRS
jgi:hypothetical protein